MAQVPTRAFVLVCILSAAAYMAGVGQLLLSALRPTAGLLSTEDSGLTSSASVHTSSNAVCARNALELDDLINQSCFGQDVPSCLSAILTPMGFETSLWRTELSRKDAFPLHTDENIFSHLQTPSGSLPGVVLQARLKSSRSHGKQSLALVTEAPFVFGSGYSFPTDIDMSSKRFKRPSFSSSYISSSSVMPSSFSTLIASALCFSTHKTMSKDIVIVVPFNPSHSLFSQTAVQSTESPSKALEKLSNTIAHTLQGLGSEPFPLTAATIAGSHVSASLVYNFFGENAWLRPLGAYSLQYPSWSPLYSPLCAASLSLSANGAGGALPNMDIVSAAVISLRSSSFIASSAPAHAPLPDMEWSPLSPYLTLDSRAFHASRARHVSRQTRPDSPASSVHSFFGHAFREIRPLWNQLWMFFGGDGVRKTGQTGESLGILRSLTEQLFSVSGGTAHGLPAMGVDAVNIAMVVNQTPAAAEESIRTYFTLIDAKGDRELTSTFYSAKHCAQVTAAGGESVRTNGGLDTVFLSRNLVTSVEEWLRMFSVLHQRLIHSTSYFTLGSHVIHVPWARAVHGLFYAGAPMMLMFFIIVFPLRARAATLGMLSALASIVLVLVVSFLPFIFFLRSFFHQHSAAEDISLVWAVSVLVVSAVTSFLMPRLALWCFQHVYLPKKVSSSGGVRVRTDQSPILTPFKTNPALFYDISIAQKGFMGGIMSVCIFLTSCIAIAAGYLAVIVITPMIMLSVMALPFTTSTAKSLKKQRMITMLYVFILLFVAVVFSPYTLLQFYSYLTGAYPVEGWLPCVPAVDVLGDPVPGALYSSAKCFSSLLVSSAGPKSPLFYFYVLYAIAYGWIVSCIVSNSQAVACKVDQHSSPNLSLSTTSKPKME